MRLGRVSSPTRLTRGLALLAMLLALAMAFRVALVLREVMVVDQRLSHWRRASTRRPRPSACSVKRRARRVSARPTLRLRRLAMVIVVLPMAVPFHWTMNSPLGLKRRIRSSLHGTALAATFSCDSAMTTSINRRALHGCFKKRFTDDVTGIGGRLDFKKLDGTHVTPNAPRLPSEAELERMLNSVGMGGDIASGLSEAVAGMREVAGKASDEREAASETVAEFVRREARKAASG